MTARTGVLKPNGTGDNGVFNADWGLSRFGLEGYGAAFFNLEAPELYEHAIARGEARIAAGGALSVTTGQHTGRSAQDKFVVHDATTPVRSGGTTTSRWIRASSTSCWPTCRNMPAAASFTCRTSRAAPTPRMRINARVITEFAWHSLFIRNLLIRPDRAELASFVAGHDHPRPAHFPRPSRAPRLPHRDGDRLRLHPQHRADRRHLLCRRDEEVGLHLPQLHAAAKGRDADALLGQCRAPRAMPPCSSAFRAPARPRSRPTRRAP